MNFFRFNLFRARAKVPSTNFIRRLNNGANKNNCIKKKFQKKKVENTQDKEHKQDKQDDKINVPKAVREQVWIKYIGKKYEDKCYVTWCNNDINVFNFHAGHNIPKSKGGGINIENLRPICCNCNLSMSNKYSIEEWIEAYN